MRMRVFASRVNGGQLCTKLIYTSEPEPDDDVDEIMTVMGLAQLPQDIFEADNFALVPEMEIVFHRRPTNYGGGNWDCTHLDLMFRLYWPESDWKDMTSEQVLRYLEYCVRW